MAFSFWGCGSEYRGDWLIPFEGDTHRIQTEWVTIFFIPVIPVRSVSVLAEGEEEFHGIPPLFWGTRQFMTIINLKIFLPQVLWIYSWWALCLAFLNCILFMDALRVDMSNAITNPGWAPDFIRNMIETRIWIGKSENV